MKRVAISMAVAAVLMMSGCGEKKGESTQQAATKSEKSVTQSAPAATESAPATQSTPKAEAPVTQKVEAAAKRAAQKSEAVTESVKAEAKKVEAAAGAATSQPKAAAADGASLFVKCAGCHGSKGEKHALGQSNVIAGQPKADLIKKIEGYQKGTYGGPMKGVMKGQVGSLTPEQIDALAGYISTLK